MKKFLLLCFVGYLLYVVFRSDDKQPTDTVGTAGTSQGVPTKNSVSPNPKERDATVSGKSIGANKESQRTNEIDSRTGPKSIEKVESPVKSEQSLEDKYNQRKETVDRQFQWCENFSKSLEYYVCRHQNPTDHTHRKDWHLALHSSQRLLFFGGNDYPYFAYLGRGLNPQGGYDRVGFEPYESIDGKAVVSSYSGRRILEFSPVSRKLFYGDQLLNCKREPVLKKEIKVSVCEKGFILDHPPAAPAPQMSKPLEFSPPLNPESSNTYKPSPLN
jgi:hypothetical protein